MKKILSIVLVLALIVGALVTFTACGKKEEKKDSNSIVGSWKYDGSEYGNYEFIYTFNEDGTGKYEAAGRTMEFTYETKDGNKLSILYKGNTASFDTEYEIKDNTLNVKDSLGNDTIYKKVK